MYRASGRPELAVVELQQAVLLDTTNQYAEIELRKAREDAQLIAERSSESRLETLKRQARGSRAKPPILEPASDKPVSLNFPQPVPIKQIYKALADAAGLNVIFDPQLKNDNVEITLTNMEFQRALETLMRQENHFYKVIDERTVMIAADTPRTEDLRGLVIGSVFSPTRTLRVAKRSGRSQTTRISVNKARTGHMRDTADTKGHRRADSSSTTSSCGGHWRRAVSHTTKSRTSVADLVYQIGANSSPRRPDRPRRKCPGGELQWTS